MTDSHKYIVNFFLNERFTKLISIFCRSHGVSCVYGGSCANSSSVIIPICIKSIIHSGQ
jgi:hypothetical protein